MARRQRIKAPALQEGRSGSEHAQKRGRQPLRDSSDVTYQTCCQQPRIECIGDYQLRERDMLPSVLCYPYVLTSYRFNFSLPMCLYSLVRLHNESTNIYSHLLAAAYFLWEFARLWVGAITDYDSDPLFVLYLYIFYLATSATFLFSSVFHLFNANCLCVCRRLLKLDICGITIGTIGCFYCCLHRVFSYSVVARSVYLGTITVLGILCTVVLMVDKFSESEWRAVRVSLLAALAGFGVLPSAHAIYVFGWAWCMGMAMRVLLMYSLFAVGLFFYATGIPERLFPRSIFDVLLPSHTIWHVFVWAGFIAHYHTILYIFQLTENVTVPT